MTWQEFTRVFIPLLISVDPFGVLPVFISLTSTLSKEEQRTISFQSVGTALAAAIAFMFLGETLFDFLHITVNDFQIAGGILLLVLSILDLLSRGKPAVNESMAIGIVPLAMPLIAGPATLTTMLVLARTYGYGPTALGLALNLLILLAALLCARILHRLLGVGFLTAVSKLVMLLLAAIAVNFIRVGITQIVLQIKNTPAITH
jgi:multiple antibiotic resistance protein